MNSPKDFCGPIFVVGMPRSGTKLLRSLIAQHPDIGISEIESHFIPYMIATFGDSPNFADRGFRRDFCAALQKTGFGWFQSQRGFGISDEIFANNPQSWAALFEAVFRYFLQLEAGNTKIWGDKTPGYVRHIPLLKKIFPEARIIHIIRHPLDYSLSVRNAWHKSMRRAAARWFQTMDRVMKEKADFGSDYMEVCYEDLLRDPESTMKEICAFLGLNYHEAMVRLSAPIENLGDAQGKREIVRNNQNKYVTKLSPKAIKRLEEIVFPSFQFFEQYQPLYGRKYRPLTRLENWLYTLYDGAASAHFHVFKANLGLKEGLRFFYNFHKTSSWR